jgi:hypothetical protein
VLPPLGVAVVPEDVFDPDPLGWTVVAVDWVDELVPADVAPSDVRCASLVLASCARAPSPSLVVSWPLAVPSNVLVTVAFPPLPLDDEPMPGPLVVLLVRAAIPTIASIVRGTANNVPFSTFFFTSRSYPPLSV